jgi:flagellar motor component MotA
LQVRCETLASLSQYALQIRELTRDHLGQIQQDAEAISATLAGTALLLGAAGLVAPPLAVGLGVLSIIAALGSTFGDPQTLGTSIAGYLHFQNDVS